MSYAHNPVIHFLGSTSPVFPFFKDYICSTSTYSGIQLCAFSSLFLSLIHGELRLVFSLLTNFTAGDILISCIPIEVASAVLRALIAHKNSLHLVVSHPPQVYYLNLRRGRVMLLITSILF